MSDVLTKIVILFGSLSLLAFGGGNAVLPAMQKASVDANHWMSARDFLDLFAISRLAPGPGSLIVTLVGLKAGGLVGAILATAAMYGPSCLVLHLCARLWHRYREASWRETVERGLAPLAIGLVFASAIALMRGTQHQWSLIALTSVSAIILAATEIPPLAILAAGGMVGYLAHL